MGTVLMWIGIAVIVAGWIALAWQAAKWMAVKDELDKFPERKKVMMLRRNYCRMTIIAGIVILLISIAI